MDENWTALDQPVPDLQRPFWIFRTPSGMRLLSLGDNSLWSYEGARFAPLAATANIDTQYVTAAEAYFDQQAGAIRLAVLRGYGQEPSKVFELSGESWTPVETTGALPATHYDRVVWHQGRQQLVHLRAVEGEGVEAALLIDGTWQKAGGKAPGIGGYGMTAGYDQARGLVVVVAGPCAGFDGERWIEVPKLPGSLGTPVHFISKRKSVELVMMATERATEPRNLLHALGPDGWQSRDGGRLVPFDRGLDCPRGCCVEDADGRERILFFACRPAPNECDRLYAEYDGQTVVPSGPLVPPTDAVRAGFGRIVAHERTPIFQPESTELAWAELREGAWMQPPPFSGGVLALILDGERTLRVGLDGAVHARGGGEWNQLANGPSDFSKRTDAAVAWDAEGRKLFVVSGEPLAGGRFPADLWCFTESTGWQAMSAKGKKPALSRAALAWDRARQRLVLFGGANKAQKESEVVYEFDGKAWQEFPLQGASFSRYGSRPSFELDPVTNQLVLVSKRRVTVYAGSGVFLPLSDDRVDGSATFDGHTRRVVTVERSEAGIQTFCRDVARELDALAKSGPLAVDERKSPKAGAQPRDSKQKEQPAPMPAQRYLQSNEDGADKFWFAELSGSSYTLHWGRRGSEGQRKTFDLASAEAARREFEKKVTAKLDKGYFDAPEGKAASAIAGRTAYLWKLGKKGADLVGGAAVGSAPSCAQCGAPMMHLVTLGREALGPNAVGVLKEHESLSVFMCASADGACETSEAFSGANAVVLRKESVKELAESWVDAGHTSDVPKAKAQRISYKTAFETDPEGEEADDPVLQNKCGGYVAWFQGEAIPDCPSCGKPMSFAAQFSEFDPKVNFGGDGVAYVFVCEEEHQGAVLWQSG